MAEEVRFDLSGVRAGFVACLPITVSVFAYGFVFGLLTGQAGIDIAKAVMMSALVFAGSAQFVALDMWVSPLPVGALVLTTLIINLRHVLMGAALRPWFGSLSPGAAYGSMFFMTDENWALTMREFMRGGRNAGFLLGSGLAVFLAWVSATAAGAAAGGAIRDPAAYGLDFAFTAVFIALLVGLWRGRSDILPWLAAAAAAAAAAAFVPGKWYILIGSLAGTAIGAWQREPARDER
ncbi:MAG: AzlC family ABC transporter permease [Rhodospirillales bacterium]|nr:AzlC family ABC transporter permease [Rhodospirillales bacterium]